MGPLNVIERMTEVINDPYNVKGLSNYGWRQARAMEAIDTYRLSLLYTTSGSVRVSFSDETYNVLAAFPKMQEIIQSPQPKYFKTAFDAIEFFLKTLKEIQDAKETSPQG